MTAPQQVHVTPGIPARASRFKRTMRTVPRVAVRLGAFVGFLIVAVIVASFFVDGPLRRSIESGMNRRLTGYTVQLPSAHFNLFTLAVTLRDLKIVQDSHPATPVAVVPHLRASVQWRELVSRHIVSNFQLDNIRLNIDRRQLHAEKHDSVDLEDHGWRQAALAIFPFQINQLDVANGDIVYVDEDPANTLHLSRVNLRVNNIRNIHSKEREYPSPVHLEATVFDEGHITVDGHLDLLAEPSPGVYVTYDLGDIPVARLNAIASRENLTLKSGTLASHGLLEFGPKVKSVHIANVNVAGLRADYQHNIPRALANVNAAVTKVNNEPGVFMRVDTLNVSAAELGMMRLKGKHPYRLFFKNADMHLLNYSNQFREGDALATFRGKFMGGGPTVARAQFRSAKAGPDFDLDIAIEEAPLAAMNEMLSAHGKIDVTKGVFSFYSQLSVANHQMSGYVKPLFEHVKVYDWDQDKDNHVVNQLYQLVAGVVMKLFRNWKTGDVATRSTISGPVGGTVASSAELIVNAFENAFVKAIAPGFDKLRGKSDKKNVAVNEKKQAPPKK